MIFTEKKIVVCSQLYELVEASTYSYVVHKAEEDTIVMYVPSTSTFNGRKAETGRSRSPSSSTSKEGGKIHILIADGACLSGTFKMYMFHK